MNGEVIGEVFITPFKVKDTMVVWQDIVFHFIVSKLMITAHPVGQSCRYYREGYLNHDRGISDLEQNPKVSFLVEGFYDELHLSYENCQECVIHLLQQKPMKRRFVLDSLLPI